MCVYFSIWITWQYRYNNGHNVRLFHSISCFALCLSMSARCLKFGDRNDIRDTEINLRLISRNWEKMMRRVLVYYAIASLFFFPFSSAFDRFKHNKFRPFCQQTECAQRWAFNENGTKFA